MPVSAAVVAKAATFARGIKSEFRATYDRDWPSAKQVLSGVAELDIPSVHAEEIYGYDESVPHPRRRPFGKPIPIEGFKARNFTVVNHAYSRGITWSEEQMLFDQLNSLERQAKMVAKAYSLLPIRRFFQVLLAATDAELLPAIPNAPDGAALYAALDGASANRFGVSGGNIYTGTGVATSEAIRNDIYGAIARMSLFQDTKGQVLSETFVDAKFALYYNLTNQKVVSEALKQPLTFKEGSTGVTGAAVSNIALPLEIEMRGTPRITDNDMFLFKLDPPVPVYFEQRAKPLEEYPQIPDNSDLGRRWLEYGYFWDEITGTGLNLPLWTIKINN